LSNENNSDEIPVEVISEEKLETNISEEKSKHVDGEEPISEDTKIIGIRKTKSISI